MIEALPPGVHLAERVRMAIFRSRTADEETIAILRAMLGLSEDLHRVQRMLLPIYRYYETGQRFDDPEVEAELEQLKARISARDDQLMVEPRKRLAAGKAISASSTDLVAEG